MLRRSSSLRVEKSGSGSTWRPFLVCLSKAAADPRGQPQVESSGSLFGIRGQVPAEQGELAASAEEVLDAGDEREHDAEPQQDLRPDGSFRCDEDEAQG